jgi:hypothetical protein
MEFNRSTGQLHRFQECYGIHHKTICGEESDAPRDIMLPLREEHLKDTIKCYSLNDMCNAYEAALLYKLARISCEIAINL